MRVGPPDAHAHAAEVGAAESPLERLQAVVAREAAAQSHLDAPERQVDLVVHHHHVVEVDAERAARGPGRLPDSFM